MTSTTEYEDCVKHIKFRFGDELATLCDIKEENIYINKELVVGWLLTRDKTITGKAYLKLYPIIYHRDDYGGRTEYSEVELGYKTIFSSFNTLSTSTVLKPHGSLKSGSVL